MTASPAPISIYIHWPFCLAKCPYCDFNSHVAGAVDVAAWRRKFCSEISLLAGQLGPRRIVSVFFGGGTPSLMPPDLVGDILLALRKIGDFANDVEITLEANPTSVEQEKFRDFAAAGVNRVSIGVQALDDEDLRALGRQHNAAEAVRAVEIAQSIFARSSFDLIYARQHQSLAAWRAELERALALNAGHLSLYQLTIEQGTRFGDWYRRGKLLGLPNDDLAADMYGLTQELCDAAGLPAYEISNHARSGHESRHNLTYWRYGEYAGLGPGAHGRVRIAGQWMASEAIAAPQGWLSADATTRYTPLDDRERAQEYLLMGLRLEEGVARERLAQMGYEPNRQTIDMMLKEGWLHETEHGFAASAQGRPVLNHLLAKLLE